MFCVIDSDSDSDSDRPFSDEELRTNAPQVITCNEFQREVSVSQNIAGKHFDRVFLFDKVPISLYSNCFSILFCFAIAIASNCIRSVFRFLVRPPNRKICMIKPLYQLSMKFLRVLTVLFSHMDKLVLVKHIQWKAIASDQR